MAQIIKQTISHLFIAVVLFIGILGFTANGFADTEKAKESFNKGQEYKKANDNENALLSYKLCVKEDPGFIDAYINMGTIYFLTQKYDEALSNFKIATEKDPKNFDAFTNLGKVQYQLKKYAEAELSFKSAIAIKEDAELYKQLGKVYYKKNNYPEVISSFNKSHELGGGDHLTYYMLGKAYQKSDNTAEAIKALNKSTSIRPDYFEAHSALGQIYLTDSKYTKAAEAFKKAMNTKSKRKYNAAYNYAIAIETSNPENYADNIANWKTFVKMAKGNPNATNDISVAEGHIKELEDALEKSKLQ